MTTTSIEWTRGDDGAPGKSWNCLRGCSRISPGCGGPNDEGGCYAEAIAVRFSGPGQPFEGFASRDTKRWTRKVSLIKEKLLEPLSWKKPARVFVNSMSDAFHEELPFVHIAAMFGMMAICPHLTFQILTKRAERMREFFTWLSGNGDEFVLLADHLDEALSDAGISPTDRRRGKQGGGAWPLRNVWLGVSVENQKYAEERIPFLLQTPAAVRFVSYEPALGPVDFRNLRTSSEDDTLPYLDSLTGYHKGTPEPFDPAIPSTRAPLPPILPPLDWLIVGGESGDRSRECDVEWARSAIAQTRPTSTKCFVKQLGANPRDSSSLGFERYDLLLKHPKGGDPSEWSADLRVQEFPEPR